MATSKKKKKTSKASHSNKKSNKKGSTKVVRVVQPPPPPTAVPQAGQGSMVMPMGSMAGPSMQAGLPMQQQQQQQMQPGQFVAGQGQVPPADDGCGGWLTWLTCGLLGGPDPQAQYGATQYPPGNASGSVHTIMPAGGPPPAAVGASQPAQNGSQKIIVLSEVALPANNASGPSTSNKPKAKGSKKATAKKR